MANLLQTFLNVLGYYNLSPTEYYQIYGDTYYVLTRFQLFDQTKKSDSYFIDIANQQIATLIKAQLEANTDYVVVYDFVPLLSGLGPLQIERIIDSVSNGLEEKGYSIRNNWGRSGVIRITWRFKIFRMFKATPPQNPPI